MKKWRMYLIWTGMLVFSSITVGSVTPPTGAPSWWNDNTAPYWGFENSGGEKEKNFAEFDVSLVATDAVKPTDPGKNTLGKYYRFEMQNGYRPELVKYFYFYAEGTGAGFLPGSSEFPVSGLYPPGKSSTIVYIRPFTPTIGGTTGEWSVLIEGIAIPQPDVLYFSFNVWGMSEQANSVQLTSWSAGEICITPEPATMLLLGLGGLSLLRKKK